VGVPESSPPWALKEEERPRYQSQDPPEPLGPLLTPIISDTVLSWRWWFVAKPACRWPACPVESFPSSTTEGYKLFLAGSAPWPSFPSLSKLLRQPGTRSRSLRASDGKACATKGGRRRRPWGALSDAQGCKMETASSETLNWRIIELDGTTCGRPWFTLEAKRRGARSEGPAGQGLPPLRRVLAFPALRFASHPSRAKTKKRKKSTLRWQDAARRRQVRNT
jgi:hypothetical protein